MHSSENEPNILPDNLERNSGLSELDSATRVDGPWYLQRYGDVAASGMGARDHYLLYGRNEGRFPNALVEELNRVSRASAALEEQSSGIARQLHLRQQLANEAVQQRLDEFAKQIDGMRQHIPALLNAIASVPALGYELAALKATQTKTDEALKSIHERQSIAADRENEWANAITNLQKAFEENHAEHGNLWKNAEESRADRGNLWSSAEEATRHIGELWSRIEFVRKEIMYEMRFGLEAIAIKKPTTKIVNKSKLDAARNSGNIFLNLGCGQIPLDGYINIDFRELPGVDIVADVGHLPIDIGSVTEISSFHVLEHFPQEQLRRLLPYWRSLLRSAGRFRAVVPDGEAMLNHYRAGTYTFEDFRMVLFGAQEYEGDFHFNMFTPDTLVRLMTEAGFSEITIPARGRKNDICYELEIVATAP
jgi:hypothetical protein